MHEMKPLLPFVINLDGFDCLGDLFPKQGVPYDQWNMHCHWSLLTINHREKKQYILPSDMLYVTDTASPL